MDKIVILKIQNTSNAALINPRVFLTSGRVAHTIPHRIEPDGNADIGFHKTDGSFCGVEGVVIYQVEGGVHNLCIFFSNPYIGHNGFYMLWRDDQDLHANADLCAEMANQQWEITNEMRWHEVDGPEQTANGFMTQHNTAELTVIVSNQQ